MKDKPRALDPPAPGLARTTTTTESGCSTSFGPFQTSSCRRGRTFVPNGSIECRVRSPRSRMPAPSASRTPGIAPDQPRTARGANIQIVMPGEIARAHRHSAAALRLIIEGRGGYTVVNGERVPMYPGDLVLTPNWSWHDHANDTDMPMIWLDGLDTPLVRMLEAGFYEEYHEERQDFGAAVNASQWHYPMSEMRAALQQLAVVNNGDTGEGIILEYKNRRTLGPVMPTIACHMQLLPPGEKTRARRRVCCTNYHVVEGAGYSMVGEERLDWEDKDVFTVPTWTFCEHVNSGDRPAFLFSFSDAPVMKALSLYRDETRA